MEGPVPLKVNNRENMLAAQAPDRNSQSWGAENPSIHG